MITTAPYDLFPVDGSGDPPTEEEISGEIDSIIMLFKRGFISKDELAETMTSFTRCAMLFGYAHGIKTRNS